MKEAADPEPRRQEKRVWTGKHTYRRRGYGGSTSECLEASVDDIPRLLIHLDLQLHDIATRWSAN